MQAAAKHFQLIYNLALIEAEKTIQDEKEIYSIHFSNEVPPVILHSVQLPNGNYYWDTIPAGNTELACAIGSLIEQYYKEHPGGEDETDE